MSPRYRYLVLALVGTLLVGAVVMHRWPWRDAADLTTVRDRITALELEAAARSSRPTLGYVPRVAGSIADPRASALEILRQLPGVADVQALVTCPKPTARLLHVADRLAVKGYPFA